ncbi:hypothetical protein [Paenibacillus sp. GCM10027626]|uniref:hypothetical protein n=1 Tax=Paenibacillus sp. GCM10027626 TaxID=3273411 RepID=UPI00362D1F02
MKRLYQLLQVEFSSWALAVLLLSCGVIMTPCLFVYTALRDYNEFTIHQRFEDLFLSAGGSAVFILYLLVLLLFFAKTVYGDYWGSKGVYTLLTLPIKRMYVYTSKLIALCISMLVLIAAQLLGIALSYSVYASKVASYGDGRFVTENGLFLAFVRSRFFRLLLPPTWPEWLFSLTLLVVLASGCYYVVLCERAKRFWAIVPFIAAIWLMIRAINARLDIPYGDSLAAQYWHVSLLLGCTVWFIGYGIRLVKRGAIV